MGLSGRCACGAVRYASSAEPTFFLNCHCRDCQRATGSGYAAIAVVPAASLTVNGEARYHAATGDSGHRIERGFCPACGSPLLMRLERLPDAVAIHAASLDDPALHRPAMDIFTTSAQPWDHMNPELRKFPKAPVR
jgi:hypothetical protein